MDIIANGPAKVIVSSHVLEEKEVEDKDEEAEKMRRRRCQG